MLAVCHFLVLIACVSILVLLCQMRIKNYKNNNTWVGLDSEKRIFFSRIDAKRGKMVRKEAVISIKVNTN